MKSILVIEDDNTVREGIVDLLREENFEVSGAENGKIGLELAQQIIPDLIISDILMPELDGYGVLSKLQEDPLTASIPFIFLSAMTGESDIRAGMKIGADDYLTKPYKAQDLLDAVNARLNKAAKIKDELNEINNVILRSLPHELRTPLVSILGYSQLLTEDASDFSADEVKSIGENIKTSGLVLLETIQKFLIHNEVQTVSVDKSRLNAIKNSVLHSAGNFIAHFAKTVCKKHNRLADLQLNLVEGTISISDYYLQIIIEETVGNAVKFSPADSPIILKSVSGNGFYTITITDNGIGMSQNQVRSIGLLKQFDRDKNFQNGVGIGLSLVKKLVDLHDGIIEISSEAGKYTTISIAIPLAA
jgi:CheY-like chemotaxis protein